MASSSTCHGCVSCAGSLDTDTLSRSAAAKLFTTQGEAEPIRRGGRRLSLFTPNITIRWIARLGANDSSNAGRPPRKRRSWRVIWRRSNVSADAGHLDGGMTTRRNRNLGSVRSEIPLPYDDLNPSSSAITSSSPFQTRALRRSPPGARPASGDRRFLTT